MAGTSWQSNMVQGTIDPTQYRLSIGGKCMGFLGPTWYIGDDSAAPGTLYHYTSVQSLKRILDAGVIRPHKTLPDDREPLVWMSSNAIWEAASGRKLPNGQPMGFDTQAQLGGGFGRVQVVADVAELDWSALRRLVSPRWLAMAEQPHNTWFAANCSRWRATRRPVTREHWLAIATWRAPRWVELPYSWNAE